MGTVKEFFKDAAKKGTKLAGKTLIKGAFDIKTWVLIYMAVVGTRAYNKLSGGLAREAEINRDAAERIEQRISTPKGMEETCKKYNLTEAEVKEVIDMQRNLSNTQKAVIKTTQDSKKSWRDYLPGAKFLRDKGVKDGLEVDGKGKVSLAMDAYEEAEAALKTKEQTKATQKSSER